MTLSDEIERLDGPSKELMQEAFWRVHGIQPGHMDWSHPAMPLAQRCHRFIEAEAWLDAAMTLVPEGWFPNIDCASESNLGNVMVELWRMPVDGQSHYERATAATPALALAAAALRARTEEKGHG